MLQFLDVFFTVLHLLIIGFNLFGWIWKGTRKWHLVAVMITAASWFILGIWYGMGYCPITDWQWQVKERLGETDLPASFIKYALDQLTGSDINAATIDSLTAIGFAGAAAMGVYVNFWKKKK
ncbi:MAG TPA: DUF2784 domain-containing protein [Sphingobacteriaceae bacterium]